jgi:chromate transporter
MEADSAAEPKLPSLVQIAWVFMLIGMQSFGGGLSAWMRREVVQRRDWMSERQFVSGMALCQICPGPNAVNLSVFIGTTLRGRMGAVAALVGMLVVPVIVVLTLGGLFARVQDLAWIASMMAGLGAGAIGMNLAMGIGMTRANIRGAVPAAVAAVVAVAVGIIGLPILPVLGVMLPVSLLLARVPRA